MSELPDEFVQCVVTSPPYWGLRKYAGLPDLIWGGTEDCQHKWMNNIRQGEIRKNEYISGGNSFAPRKENPKAFEKVSYNLPFCLVCGAWKGSVGLEPEPDCGRPFMKLKNNLTDKQKEYVVSELKRLGLI